MAARALGGGQEFAPCSLVHDSVRAFCPFLADQDMPSSLEDVDASHVRAFLLAEEQHTSAASAAVHLRNIRVEAPKITEKAAFFTDEELARLLTTCSGAAHFGGV